MFKSYGLYSHIRANQLRTVFLLTGFIVLLFALMFSVALVFEALNSDPGSALEWIISQAFEDLKNSWPIGVVAALIWFCIAYLFHQKMIDFATGAASLSRVFRESSRRGSIIFLKIYAYRVAFQFQHFRLSKRTR